MTDESGSVREVRRVLAPNKNNLATRPNRVPKRMEPLLKEKLESLERLKVLKVAERNASLNSQQISITHSGKPKSKNSESSVKFQ